MLTLGSGTIVVAPWVAGASPAAWSTTYPSPVTIGEAGGDIEFDIQWSSKDFYGQSVFSEARGFYGGKVTVKAKKVELYPANLSQLSSMLHTVSAPNDVYTGVNSNVPQFITVKFVHTRSDNPAKTVTIYLWKATSANLQQYFIREDISTVEVDFEALADLSMTNRDVLRVEATQ